MLLICIINWLRKLLNSKNYLINWAVFTNYCMDFGGILFGVKPTWYCILYSPSSKSVHNCMVNMANGSTKIQLLIKLCWWDRLSSNNVFVRSSFVGGGPHSYILNSDVISCYKLTSTTNHCTNGPLSLPGWMLFSLSSFKIIFSRWRPRCWRIFRFRKSCELVNLPHLLW